MRKVDAWFSKYEESHQNPTNVLIHRVAVPLILFSILGALWPLQILGGRVVWPALFLFFAFALSLSPKLSLAFAAELVGMAALAALLQQVLGRAMLPAMGGLFAAAWVAQFVGHRIEGKRPAFFDDLLFLLVGPLWTLSLLGRRRKM